MFIATFREEIPEHQQRASRDITPLISAVVTLNTFARKTHSHLNIFRCQELKLSKADKADPLFSLVRKYWFHKTLMCFHL